MINASLSEKILFMGPEHRNHKGGVGAIIDSYASLFPGMKFIPSYNGAYPGWKNHLLFVRAWFRLCGRLLRDRSIRIVHLHGASKGSFYRKYVLFLTAQKLFRRKVVYHIHGGGFYDFYSQAGNGVQRRIGYFLDHADGVICLSASWEKLYAEHFRPKRLRVVPNFVGLPAALPERQQSPVIFLFLGLVTAAKGVYEWVEAIEELLRSGNNNIECRIGGNGEDRELAALVARKGLQPYIKVLGWVSGKEKQAALGSAQVYVLPSHKEGMPVSVLEAMAYGMPVISTRVGGIPELVEDGITGFLTEPGNKSELQQYMKAFMDDPALIGKMGRAGREVVKTRFSAEAAATELTQLYEDILNPAARPV